MFLTIIISCSILTTIAATPLGHNFRITDGKNAAPGEFPFMVQIKRLPKESTEYSNCGGSLISHQWVMSAASCVFNVQYVYIYLGSVYSMHGISYQIEPNNIIIHENFDSKSFLNDISLISIPYTTYSGRVQQIELPYKFEKDTFIGKRGTTLGWGYTKNFGPISNILKYLVVEIVENENCLQHGADIHESQLCVASEKPQSPCNGDYGGPLIYYSTDYSPVTIGIISYLTNANCEIGHPIVYTRVTQYLLWLMNKQDDLNNKTINDI